MKGLSENRIRASVRYGPAPGALLKSSCTRGLIPDKTAGRSPGLRMLRVNAFPFPVAGAFPPVHAYPLTVTSSHRPCTCFPFHRYPDTGCPCCIAVVKMVLNNYMLPRIGCQGDFCIIRPNIHFLDPIQLCIANCNFGQKVQTACFASLLCTGGIRTLCGFS